MLMNLKKRFISLNQALIILILVLMVASCSATGPSFKLEPDPAYGVLYVYRPNAFTGCAVDELITNGAS